MKTSIYDNALFFWPEDKGLQGITAFHADDFIFGGNKAFYQKIFNPSNGFKGIYVYCCVSHEEVIMFKYTGLSTKQYLNENQVDQRRYVG